MTTVDSTANNTSFVRQHYANNTLCFYVTYRGFGTFAYLLSVSIVHLLKKKKSFFDMNDKICVRKWRENKGITSFMSSRVWVVIPVSAAHWWSWQLDVNITALSVILSTGQQDIISHSHTTNSVLICLSHSLHHTSQAEVG